MTDIEQAIQRVIAARANLRNYADEVASHRASWDATHQELLAETKRSQDTCAAEEAALRELALAEYAKTGSKQIGPGVGIRVIPKLEYNPSVAFPWATDVTKSEEPQATIATDLEGAQRRPEAVQGIEAGQEALEQARQEWGKAHQALEQAGG